jgi:hypothetical protein
MTSDWKERSPDRIAERLIVRVEGNQSRGRASNIVLHDGSHHGLNAAREPSLAATEQLLVRFAPTHKFVTVDAWSGAGNSDS